MRVGLLVAGLFAVSLLWSAQPARASRMFLSTTSKNPAFINPEVDLTVGGTAQLFVFWQPTIQQGRIYDAIVGRVVNLAPQNEEIQAWGHDIISSQPIVSAVSYSIANPHISGTPRWDAVVAPTDALGVTPDAIVNDANAIAYGGSSLGLFTTEDPTYDATTQTWRLSTLTIQATAPGTTEIRLGIGYAGLTYRYYPTSDLYFGFGDDPLSDDIETASALADATVVVTTVPEPATFTLLVLGAIGLFVARFARARH